ncbi:uncharacterized protein BXZ73DRAFT_97468 [Epithele typhae]|uniref:uncharacterized protein n=1 Tax=Epithele typhae TaxID=378194 RepID=UPI0020083A44|nr:uncharacterized protein BXZ73DRAFT_97468 [Epithele typhae]KAH9943426.1 hypothetical protein BXZ73DRAFT_97468 [Epithele typhae]
MPSYEYNDLAPSGSPPPPSYEISQHDFDQKTSHVIEQTANGPPPRRVDDEGFEIWDDALFDAARIGVNNLSLNAGQSSRLSAGSSSTSPIAPPSFPDPKSPYGYPPEKGRAPPSAVRALPSMTTNMGAPSHPGTSSGSHSFAASSQSPPQYAAPPLQPSPATDVRPLRVQKKPARQQKERPAWYREAGLGGGSPPPSPLQSTVGSSSSRSGVPPLRRGLTVFNATERDTTPPPEFSAVGPTLDGPPYEVVLAYQGSQQGLDTEPARPLYHRASPAPPAARVTPTPPELSRTPHPPGHGLVHSQTAPDAGPQPRHLSHHPTHAQSYPPVPVPAHQAIPRPTAERSVPAVTRPPVFQTPQYGPRVSFNPQSAYPKPAFAMMPTHSEDAEAPVTDVSAFYSNAVSAQFSFNVPARMKRTSYMEQ